MSKVLESVRRAEREVRREKTSQELTQDQLADIYFSATGKHLKTVESSQPPVVIRVVEKSSFSSMIPWLITSIAFLISAFSLFSTKRVFIDVKVIDEKTPYWQSIQNDTPPVVRSTRPVAEKTTSEEEADIAPAREYIPTEDFIFEGAAKLKSTADANGLVLVNSSVSPFARSSVFFDPPIDLNHSKIVFFAKGYKGGENVAIALKDENNVMAFPRGRTFPFTQALSTKWQKAQVDLESLVPEFDGTKVRSLRFDFGSKDTENKSGDMVFIKELQIVRS